MLKNQVMLLLFIYQHEVAANVSNC